MLLSLELIGCLLLIIWLFIKYKRNINDKKTSKRFNDHLLKSKYESDNLTENDNIEKP